MQPLPLRLLSKSQETRLHSTIWPGAHRLMYYAYAHQVNPGRDPELYNKLMAQVKRTITPLEICAPAGSVVFWCAPVASCLRACLLSAHYLRRHGRMAHSPGIHRGNGGPRFAVPSDWQARPEISGLVGKQLEWFKDAPVFVDDKFGAPKTDMFEDWALAGEDQEELAEVWEE